VGIASADISDPPVIDFNFYSDADGHDIATMIRGIKDAQRILEAPAFDGHRGRPLWPSPDVRTDEQYADFVREYTGTVFHPTGTCKMGKDDTAVVDARLRVRGLKGLRVVDASIMPTIVTGNTNAPTIAIAEKGADLIKADARAA
jgi:choline dehydrogenase-like flavoprotein